MSTTYSLKFWSKSCGNTQIERVYVNADDRSSLGFFEMRVHSVGRSGGSYYDAHRAAKGDTTIETGRSYTRSLTDEAAVAIYAAIGVTAEQQADADGFNAFYSLKEHSRGVNWIFTGGAKSAKAKEMKKKAAFTITL